MNLDGMRISVIAYNTPRYLYVTLDGLSKVKGIKDFRITVYVDGGICPSTRDAYTCLASDFSSFLFEFSEKHLGLRNNIMRGIARPIEEGAEQVLYIEGDHLLHPDALDALRDDESGCFFVSLILRHEPNIILQEYNPKGNLVSAENGRKLVEWMKSDSYLGKNHPVRGYPLTSEYKGHDAAVNIFMREHDEYTSFASRVYLAHFGLIGSNLPRTRATSEILEIEKRMFAGEKQDWLPNVIDLLGSGDYPMGSAVLDSRLWPRGFTYYGPAAESYRTYSSEV